MDATVHLLQDVRERVSLKGLKDGSELKGALKDSLNELIQPLENRWMSVARNPLSS
jgi:fused signal recognition particle receptor